MKPGHNVYGGASLCPQDMSQARPLGLEVAPPPKIMFLGSFSKTISSLISLPILKLLVVLQTQGQYLKLLLPDLGQIFEFRSSFGIMGL